MALEKDRFGLTPLNWPILPTLPRTQTTTPAEVAKLLLGTQEGRESTSIRNHDGLTPLMVAVYRSEKNGRGLEVARVILGTQEGRRSIGIVDKNGDSAVHIAATSYNHEVLKLLLEFEEGRKALLAKDCYGDTPLHRAAVYCMESSIRAILGTKEGRETLRAKNNRGRIPWALAAMTHSENVDLLALLLPKVPAQPEATEEDIDVGFGCQVCLSKYSTTGVL